ncbi:hypothetical protein [Chryseobacterium sp. 52]|uniref:hypothetical protein n=1 Tax=Chryseobacterium sp. 52 TaxID=2035213 RepID=UPI00117C3641|nr:hypothetical protein [Chryseobacterium sp. 52]
MLLFSGGIMAVNAQQIKDGETIDINGIAVTYFVINKEKLKIKNQDFDRYKVTASVKNNTGKAFNIRLNSSLDLDSNSKIIEVNCINATGARLTSKRFQVGMKAHTIDVTCFSSASTVMSVTAGYYLEQGQVIENDAIFIVPAGETPQVIVRSLLSS